MQVLLAVVEDLYIFAVSMLFPRANGAKRIEAKLYLPPSRVVSASRETLEIDAYREKESIPSDEPASGASVVMEVQKKNKKAVPFAAPPKLSPKETPQKHTIVYCAQMQVPLRTAPDSESDTTIAVVTYGDMLMVLEANAEYSFVAAGDKRGYVPTAALAHKAADVYPAFMIGEENSFRETNTVRLRSFIRDEFSASLSQLPLGAHEYVYYKLLRRGAHIAWPDIRPRTPGSWEKILSTLENVAMSDLPTAGSVMEFALPQENAREQSDSEAKAHLAYVEKLLPDGTIQISEADWPGRGIYNERILVEADWRSLNSVFIVVG